MNLSVFNVRGGVALPYRAAVGKSLRAAALRSLPLLLSFMLSAGCSRGPEMAQVSGKVLYKDGTVPKGGVCVVRFEPTADTPAVIRKVATGSIEPDGSFNLSTQKPGDGVYLGKYNVTFAVWKAPREPVSLIKGVYTNSASTPYHVTVDGNMSNLAFEIERK